MGTFEIKDNFYLNGEPFQVISGAIHYFRVVPEYWRDRLEKLKAMGCNTVETYIPWNMHEPKKGEFHFEGMLDVERFIETAQEPGAVCDHPSVALYLRGMGVRRASGVASCGGGDAASGQLSAVFEACERSITTGSASENYAPGRLIRAVR